MAPGVSLSIPHELNASRKKDNIQSRVQQLVLQKGPFRGITEDSLLADIQRPAAEADDDEDQTEEEDGNASETVQASREKLFQTRVEYMQMSSFIQNSLLTAIDGISASLAAHSKYAATAMSPALQQVAPAGSIETKLIESKAVSKPASRRMNDIATVTQAEAFTSAAVQLSRASGRLVTEAQHQSKYWEQLASLRSNGWPVSRVPNDAKALVVHYGSADSGPQYRNRGVAALRQDENGDLTFSGQAESQKPKTLVVTVHRRGKLTGRFALKKEKSSRRSKLEDDLLQAREALFQEELFNEASKEARILANMGVKTRSSSIEIAVSDECSVAVSYARQPLEVPEVSQADDKLAHFVGNGLRLMLVVEHQQRHLQRAEHKPLPMSQNPRPAPEYALLRPITSLLRHHCDIAPLFETLEDYKASFRLAGLHLSVEHQSSDGTESASPALQLLRRVVTSQGLLAVPFVLNAQPAAPYDGVSYEDLDKMARTARQRYADIFRDVEALINDHIAHQRTNSRSKLGMLVPSISTFFTPLALEDAFLVQDAARAISSRRFVAPSFNDIRLVLNTAQLLSLIRPKATSKSHSNGSIPQSQIELLTFDGDVTLYEDGASLLSPEANPVINRLLHFLSVDVRIAIVTAAGYTHPQNYFNRLSGLLLAVKESTTLTAKQKSNLVVMGGESNYLLVFDDTAEHCLRYTHRRNWILDVMYTWTEEAIQSLLDVAETAFESCIKTLHLQAKVLRKERAVGIYAADQSIKLNREQLEETVLVVQQVVESSLFATPKPAHSHIPFTVFNGGADVFLDVGDKSLGVQACQKWFGGIQPSSTLHVGDQFLSGGGNDFKARSACCCAWIASPTETLALLDEMIALGASASDTR
ncbi:IMP 5'-nucleotidase [Knufia obscura]|uniref:Mediator of RNA polymerase II transcription subunit 17 n=1 Tax=Knufia obscura TaxID=1635080 RepID=A0ABR0RS54_9EURO|nr:IMP 5'-nucleotidase [Knufia obscura]